MSAVCRPGAGVLPIQKAMPSRMPDTIADKQVKDMHTTGGAPLPTKQIQQGPSFCPTCGKSHRLGTVCSKSIEDLNWDAFFKAVTVSGNKKGNPYHDSTTGHFSSAPKGGGGGGGGAPPTGGGAAPTVAEPKTESLGTANTMEAPAPSPAAAAAAPSSPPQASGGGGATMAGKVNAKPAAPMDEAGRRAAFNDKLEAIRPTTPEPKTQNQSARPRGPFSHDASNAAYHQKRAEAMQAGLPEEQAHNEGMKAGHSAYASAIRDTSASPLPGTPPPTRTGTNAAPTQLSSTPPTGPSNTIMQPSPTMMQSAPGGGAQAPAQEKPESPTQTPAPTPGGRGTPGAPGGGQPWMNWNRGASMGSAIGGGMFTPGGTFAPTAHAVGDTAHGLLTGGGGNAQRIKRELPGADKGNRNTLTHGNKPNPFQAQKSIESLFDYF